MTFLYGWYKSEHKRLKKNQLDLVTDWICWGSGGGETTKDNSQISDLHYCLDDAVL